MSQAFTALAVLAMHDAGKVALDAPAETYVPELRGRAYPTTDSAKITVRNLLSDSAGFVEDNPWGDRQQPLPGAAFTALLNAGVLFARGPGLRMEYSTLGDATLGRLLRGVSGVRYEDYIRELLMRPPGMTTTTYDFPAADPARRVAGDRWQEGR